jgi:hypothetical protein
LQLNFTAAQTRALTKLGYGDGTVFNDHLYPVARPVQRHYRETLAWCAAAAAKHGIRYHNREVRSVDTAQVLKRPFGDVLRWWDEAVSWAAIWFIRNELRVNRIHYHQFETGAALKTICRSRVTPGLGPVVHQPNQLSTQPNGRFTANLGVRRVIPQVSSFAWISTPADEITPLQFAVHGQGQSFPRDMGR